ncbi:STAS/SEC14 domain-containing protein [Halobacillus sp. B23F22_1]|uniref:STAS/SEC14 domain-containing protein n=1 Tax=Halobacillus sp. B23F22_1 TaxID=3459514 RepID=UPI00373F7551
MFTILPSHDSSTIVVEIKGEATGRDALHLDEYIEKCFNEDDKFNVIAYIKELNGITQQGLLKGMKVDAKRWKQFNKFAMISNKDWIKTPAKVGKYLPGIQVEVFEDREQEKAWKWMKQ